MRLAVGQCPTECIHYVTPRQCAVLDALLLRHAPSATHACCSVHADAADARNHGVVVRLGACMCCVCYICLSSPGRGRALRRRMTSARASRSCLRARTTRMGGSAGRGARRRAQRNTWTGSDGALCPQCSLPWTHIPNAPPLRLRLQRCAAQLRAPERGVAAQSSSSSGVLAQQWHPRPQRQFCASWA
jgi:hypothetical protein